MDDIINLQALWRGFVTRKNLMELRKVYENIIQEIEKDPETLVIWRTEGLCVPQVVKGPGTFVEEGDVVLRKKPLLKHSVDESTSTEGLEGSQSRKSSTDMLEKACQSFEEATDSSVEIQTSPVLESVRLKYLSTETSEDKSVEDNLQAPSPIVEHIDTSISQIADYKKKNNVSESALEKETNITRHEKKLRVEDCKTESEDSQQYSFTTLIQRAKSITRLRERKSRGEDGEGEACDSDLAAAHGWEGKRGLFQAVSHKPVHSSAGLWPQRSETEDDLNDTSIWGSESSQSDSCSQEDLPQDVESLQRMRRNVALELLWIQQAIIGRKNYLRLKKQMQ